MCLTHKNWLLLFTFINYIEKADGYRKLGRWTLGRKTLGRWTLGRQSPKRWTLWRQRARVTHISDIFELFFHKIRYTLYSNMIKIYSNIKKNLTLCNRIQVRCSRRCGRMKQCFSMKHPSPSISSSASVAALHVCRSASSLL